MQLRYVDHEPGTWFLVEDEDEDARYLDARYSYSAAIDDSALIRLDEGERSRVEAGGHDALTALARGIHHSAPYQEGSAYYRRNLYRSTDGSAYRAAVSAAIADHTWIAEQRRQH